MKTKGKNWCPGWESNPHEEKSPEDFKSSASAIPPPGLRAVTHSLYRLTDIFSFLRIAAILHLSMNYVLRRPWPVQPWPRSQLSRPRLQDRTQTRYCTYRKRFGS